jgi:hypothetical protein
VKVLKPDRILADDSKDMGAPAVTTTPIQIETRRESTKMRRTGIWLSVVGGVLTLVGAITVLATWDGSDSPARIKASDQPAAPTDGGGTTATTVLSTPAVNRPPGTIATGGVQPGLPGAALPPGPPPATPQEVAELLAGLPLQLEQAATSAPDGRPRDLTPEEVNKIIEDMLRQLGVKP